MIYLFALHIVQKDQSALITVYHLMKKILSFLAKEFSS